MGGKSPKVVCTVSEVTYHVQGFKPRTFMIVLVNFQENICELYTAECFVD